MDSDIDPEVFLAASIAIGMFLVGFVWVVTWSVTSFPGVPRAPHVQASIKRQYNEMRRVERQRQERQAASAAVDVLSGTPSSQCSSTLVGSETPSTVHSLLDGALPHRQQTKGGRCIVCMSTVRKRLAFVPCGHATCCEACSHRITSCPTCRRTIRERIRIYI
eukprot:Sspe_Gene.46103::Locus_22950_Transcript_1_1_Confidence_1.000_Length_636::g.46103::m.46103